MNKLKNRAKYILGSADIEINGTRPWDIQIHDERLYSRIFSGGRLALGESYMDGWWDVDDLGGFVDRALRADLGNKVDRDFKTLLYIARSKLQNLQNKSRATQVAEEHYDLGNDLYQKMLGPTMAYTCGYWKDVKSLTEAQEAKFDLICRKIGLKSGNKILDIGCGFGAFARFAALHYGANIVGTSVSKEQCMFAREFTKGLPVEIRFEDYRETTGAYDHIVSIGMFEAVGYKNFRIYMKKAYELLNDNGLFLLHTIGGNLTSTAADPWIDKYIFPNGMLPSIPQIGQAIERLFVMEDWHNFGIDYEKTLLAWFDNFKNSWDKLKNGKYNDRFYRMWTYYLLSSVGSFRSRKNQLWQIVLSKNGVLGGYQSIR